MRISLETAVALLNSGKVVGVPTETVYGLAASIKYPDAIQEIFKLKGRPSNNPLIIHAARFEDIIFFLKEASEDCEPLSKKFWPGPMTLVLPAKRGFIPSIARANLPTAAFRIPNHPLTLELLKLTGPLVMPSANLSGSPSSTKYEHVVSDFGIEFPILDGGICDKGLESTILIRSKEKWKIIRQGALTSEDFEKVLGYRPTIQYKTSAVPICPGQMYRHYAPRATLKLVKSFDNIKKGVIIGFSDRIYPQNCDILTLGHLFEPELAAANLYAILRQLDQEGHQEAYVDINFSPQGILSTLLERLERAANI